MPVACVRAGRPEGLGRVGRTRATPRAGPGASVRLGATALGPACPSSPGLAAARIASARSAGAGPGSAGLAEGPARGVPRGVGRASAGPDGARHPAHGGAEVSSSLVPTGPSGRRPSLPAEPAELELTPDVPTSSTSLAVYGRGPGPLYDGGLPPVTWAEKIFPWAKARRKAIEKKAEEQGRRWPERWVELGSVGPVHGLKGGFKIKVQADEPGLYFGYLSGSGPATTSCGEWSGSESGGGGVGGGAGEGAGAEGGEGRRGPTPRRRGLEGLGGLTSEVWLVPRDAGEDWAELGSGVEVLRRRVLASKATLFRGSLWHILRLEEVDDPDKVAALSGWRIFAADLTPPPDNDEEFYSIDLVGLRVSLADELEEEEEEEDEAEEEEEEEEERRRKVVEGRGRVPSQDGEYDTSDSGSRNGSDDEATSTSDSEELPPAPRVPVPISFGPPVGAVADVYGGTGEHDTLEIVLVEEFAQALEASREEAKRQALQEALEERARGGAGPLNRRAKARLRGRVAGRRQRLLDEVRARNPMRLLVPFSRVFVPHVSLRRKHMILAIPDEMLEAARRDGDGRRKVRARTKAEAKELHRARAALDMEQNREAGSRAEHQLYRPKTGKTKRLQKILNQAIDVDAAPTDGIGGRRGAGRGEAKGSPRAPAAGVQGGSRPTTEPGRPTDPEAAREYDALLAAKEELARRERIIQAGYRAFQRNVQRSRGGPAFM